MKDANFQIDTRREGRIGVVRLGGRLIVGNAREVEQAAERLMGEGAVDLVFALANVTHIGSSGLGLLMSLHNQTKAQDGKLVLAELSAACAESLELTRMNEIFHIVNTEAEAMRLLQEKT